MKEKLPRIDIDVEVGSTGYIIWPSADTFSTCGYSFDEIGRVVGILDGMRFFQRYTGSCMLVADIYYPDREHFITFTLDDRITFVNDLHACYIAIKGAAE